MLVKIRNWHGDQLSEYCPELYGYLMGYTDDRVKEYYVKCFDYHYCLIVDTDDIEFTWLIETIYDILSCDVTVKIRDKEVNGDLRFNKEAEFVGEVPRYELWLNDGSEFDFDVEDYDDDYWDE